MQDSIVGEAFRTEEGSERLGCRGPSGRAPQQHSVSSLCLEGKTGGLESVKGRGHLSPMYARLDPCNARGSRPGSHLASIPMTSSSPPYEVGIALVPTLQLSKLRLREIPLPWQLSGRACFPIQV